MSDDDDSATKPLERVPSGVPGLDAILQGGFFRGGVYLFLAQPGSGKTLLGSQICFRHVDGGGRALFVTLLTESHSRLLAQLQTMAFFDPKRVGAELSFVTGYQALEKDKLGGLLVLLRRLIRDHKATLLVIDGIVTAGNLAESEVDWKKFIHELQVFVELVGCMALLLSGPSEVGAQYALRTMVDGLVELRLDSVGMGAARTLEVTKFRGGGTLMGRHLFEITNAGVTVYPRTESRHGRTAQRPDPTRAPRATFGIAGLEEMLGGGLRSGSITMVLGTPGSGKTLLGLSLLAAGARAGERGIYFGFFETPAELCRKSGAIGTDLTAHVESGLIDVMWQSPLDTIADALAENVLTAVRQRGVRRLFLDGLGGFRDSLVDAQRASRFFTALFNELRALGVVTAVSDETPSLGAIEVPVHGLTAALDNVLFLRHVEVEARLRKLVSVMKMRDGVGDPSIREFAIGPQGFVVSADSTSAKATLASLAREGRALVSRRPPGKAATRSPKKGGKTRRR
jgi:circadian clock protein KaiC